MASLAGGPVPTVPSWTGEGDQPFAKYGWSVVAAGDVNNDGYDDVIVGAPLYTNGEKRRGGLTCTLAGAVVLLRRRYGSARATRVWRGSGVRSRAPVTWTETDTRTLLLAYLTRTTRIRSIR